MPVIDRAFTVFIKCELSKKNILKGGNRWCLTKKNKKTHCIFSVIKMENLVAILTTLIKSLKRTIKELRKLMSRLFIHFEKL